MAEGGLKVPLIIDREGGTKQVNDWLAGLDPEIKVEVDTGDSEAELKALRQQIDGIEQEAGEAQKGLGKLVNLANLDAWKERLGDAKDIFQGVGHELLGLTQQQEDSAVAAADLAAKGWALGASFHPLVGLIGAGVGGALGYFGEEARQAEEAAAKLKKEQEELAKAMEKAQKENDELAKSLSEASAKDVPELIGHYADLEEQLSDVSKELKATNPLFDVYLARFNLLAIAQTKDARQAGELLLKNIQAAQSAANTAIYGESKKSAAELKEEIKDLSDPKNSKSVPYLSEQLGKLWVQIDDFKNAKGLSESGSMLTSWNEQAQALTAELNAAILKKSELEKSLEEKTKSAEKKKEEAPKADKGELDFIAFQQKAFKDAADERQKLAEEEAEAQQKRVETEIEQAAQLYDAKISWAFAEHDARAALVKLEEEERKRVHEEQLAQYEEAAAFFESTLSDYMLPVIESVTGQLYENIEAGERAFKNFGQAVASGIQEALKALGRQFATQALGETAAGLASLALGPVGGVSAGAHFAAAAAFAAAALAAGVGSSLVGRRTTSESAPAPTPYSSTRAGEGFSGGPGGQSRAFATEVKAPLVINVTGVPFGALSLRELEAIGGRNAKAIEVWQQNGVSTPV